MTRRKRNKIRRFIVTIVSIFALFTFLILACCENLLEYPWLIVLFVGSAFWLFLIGVANNQNR